MSTTVDNRVVEMRFDNKHFESNVATTMSTLDKLKQKLNLSGATKGLVEVDNAAKKVDMAGLGTAVETVRSRFSALEIMGVTALANITNSAVNAGKRIVSALTIDPIKTGFSEYETKINAIQTIMSNTASKGTTMDDVTKVIGELNTYADKTIYNFAEMTRNIGTFTAAGVGLEDSAAAIQGIANLAAASGSNSQQASTAMYQLSQALSTGTVKLMDWNSVVNAGMGGEKFQEALKATAREHGVAVDDIIKKNGSFRDSLSDGWLTADILNTTLKKFTTDGAKEYAKSMIESGKWTQKQADALLKEAQAMEDAATKVKTFTQLWDTLKESAQSGWSQTWEIIVGDFEEAKETLTEFSKVISGMLEASANARNELLQGWKDAGGRADLIDSIFNVFNGVLSIIKPIKEAFREIFPPTTVKQLVGFTKGLKELTAKFKLSETASDNLKRTFKGLFAVLDIIRQVFAAVFKAVGSLFAPVSDLGGGILGITARFGDLLVKFNEILKKSDVFNKALQGIAKVIKFVISGVSKFVGWVGSTLIFPGLEGLHTLFGKIYDRITQVTDAAGNMGSALGNSSFFKVLKSLWDGVVKIGSGIITGIGKVLGGLFDKLGKGDFQGVLDFVNGIISGGIGIAIMRFIKSLSEPFEGFGDIVENLGNCLEGFQAKLKAEALMKIAGAVAILAASLLILSLVDGDRLSDALAAITLLFTELVASLAILNKMSGGTVGITKSCTAMISMSIAVLILSSALKKIAGMELDELAGGVLGIAGLLAVLVYAAKAMERESKTVIKGAGQMILMAVALKVLASVCKDLSALDWNELAVGMGGVVLSMMVLLAMSKQMTSDGQTVVKGAGQMLIMAVALKVLASACKDLAYLSWEELAVGMGGVMLLMTVLVAMAKQLTTNGQTVVKGAGQMLILAAALTIMAAALRIVAALGWSELGRGLTGIIVVTALLVSTAKIMSTDGTTMVKGAGQMLIMATSLTILAGALKVIANISWEDLAKGLVSLTVAIGLMVGTLAILSKVPNTAGSAASILLMAVALSMLTPVLMLLGAMSWSAIAKGLLVIAGAFAVIGVAGMLLQPVIPAILALSGALVLVGVAVAVAGAGLLAAGVGLTALATGLITFVGSLGAIVTGIIGIVSGVITGILKGIAEGIVAFCQVIIDGIPAIGEAIKVVILTLCDVIGECAPVMADTVLKVLVSVLAALAEHTPQIVELLFKFIIGLLDGIATHMPELIKSVVNIFTSIFTGAIKALSEIDSSSLVDGLIAVGLMAGLVAALAAIAPLVPAAMAGAAGMGFVMAQLATVLAVIGAVAQLPGLKWLIEEGGEVMKEIGNAIGGFIGGIIGGIAEGITSALPQIGTDLSTFMENIQPFVEGAKQIDASAMDGVKSLVGIILALTGANILESITSWLTGGSSLEKFGEELASFGPNIRAYADAVSGIDAGAVEASANAAKALADMASHIPNEGGVAAWFAGENSIAKFGTEIVTLGAGLKGFSDSVAGIVPENIVAAANAAKALATMTSSIPNEGGVVSWFAGDNSISKFAGNIVALGAGLKGFSDAVVGVVPENILAAANAAKALAEMTATIPNEGGIAAWFSGDNSVSDFSVEIIKLGHGLKGFSDAIVGVVPENIVAAANAAKALAEITQVIPNQGGIVSWFAGDSSVSKFATDIVALGSGLKGFSDATVGLVPENVTAAANSAKALAEMASVVPNQGGVVSWFAGDNSVAKFGSNLPKLGAGLKGFSDSIAGINTENVTAAANASKSLADLVAVIPNESGIKAWFAGETSVAKFSTDLPLLGAGLKGFSVAVTGIVPENVVSAANAAKALAEMTAIIPKEGGIKAWFTGETSIANFADRLPTLGSGIKGFSDSVIGINSENVTAAANAAKALGEMASTIPKNTDKLPKFGDNINSFGSKIKSYFSKISGINGESVSTAKTVVDSVKSVASINAGGVESASKAIDKLVKSIKDISKIKGDAASNFKKVMSELGNISADAFVKAFDKLDSEMTKIGRSAVESFVKAVTDKASSAKTAAKDMAKKAASAISETTNLFTNAGRDVVRGFANGISANTYRAEAKSRAMARAAASAAKKELDEHSPSKVGYEIGDFFGVAFVNAIGDYASKAYDAGSEMAGSAKSGLSEAISKVASTINGDMDMQPTIRPVLDLSDVQSGADTINSLLGSGSTYGIMTNVGSISSMMNSRNQNGENSELISAIDKLRGDLGNIGNTYSINGITYDDGSNIAEAVKSIARAAKIERRT